MILIKNGTLHTAVSKEPLQADILVDGRKGSIRIGAGLAVRAQKSSTLPASMYIPVS